jgi:hypothetical protein
MSRQRFAWAIALALLSALPAFAWDPEDNSGSWWQNFKTDWHRNNCWPKPFVYPDRASVVNFNMVQINKGWQATNLLGAPHFDADGSKLSPAGLTKIRMILTQNPTQYRNVFVERGMTDEVTSRRLAVAQQAVNELARGPYSEVVVSDMMLPTSTAESVNSANNWLTGYMQSMPKITTEAFQSADSSGGGSGGGH